MAKKNKRRYGNPREVAEKRMSGGNYGHIKIPEGVRMFTPEVDTVAVLDILPYEVTDKHHMDKIEPGVLWYTKPYKVHNRIGPNDDSFVCLTTFNKPCPICDYGEELKQEEEPDEKKIDKTKPKYRNLYAVKVLSYDGKKKFDKKEIHLFDFSYHNFHKKFETQLKKKEDFKTFFLPEEGKSLEITFDEGSFGGFKFPEATRIDFVDRKKQYDEDIVDDVPNLDDILIQSSYDDLEATFHGDDVASASEEPETKKDKKDKKKKKKSKEVAPDEPEEVKEKKRKKKKNQETEDVSEAVNDESVALSMVIDDAESVDELIDIIKNEKATFGEYKKELKKIEKVKKLKKRMMEIVNESTPVETEPDDSSKKKKKGKKKLKK